MSELISEILMVAGAAFVALAGLGLLRFPDVLSRMHASTKAGTLGVGLIVVAAAVHFEQLGVTTRAVMIVFFLLLTAPVAAHLIGRAAYRTGTPLGPQTRIDELATALDPPVEVGRRAVPGSGHAPLGTSATIPSQPQGNGP
jgi:multicomponent Na+:H+ antiporter subunit G